MLNKEKLENLANEIWKGAIKLRGKFKAKDYPSVILPMIMIRRIECVLTERRKAIAPLIKAQTPHLDEETFNKISKIREANDLPFFNRSDWTLKGILAESSSQAEANFRSYLNGFSDNIQEIIDKFDFRSTLKKVVEAKRLYSIIQLVADEDLSQRRLSNIEMGYVYEELLQRFSQDDAKDTGEHFTPREIIRVMVELLEIAFNPTVSQQAISIYDPACGTGGMLSVAKEHLIEKAKDEAEIKQIEHLVLLNGQEMLSANYAVCKADMILKGEAHINITNGNSLIPQIESLEDDGDQQAEFQFDYMLSNPPFGVDWSEYKTGVEKLKTSRYRWGMPPSNDGALLFLLTMIEKMKRPANGGSKIAILFNGSPLSNGDATQGESEIRRHILENDLLDCVIMIPDQMFYSTGIYTYIWLLNNNKPEHKKDKVLIVNAREQYEKEPKSFGNKRNRLTDKHRRWIHEQFTNWRENEYCKVFDTGGFAFHKVAVVFWQEDEYGEPMWITEPFDVGLNNGNVNKRFELYGDMVFYIRIGESAKIEVHFDGAKAFETLAAEEIKRALPEHRAKNTGDVKKWFKLQNAVADFYHRHYIEDNEYIPFDKSANDKTAYINAFLAKEIDYKIIRWQEYEQLGYEILPNKYFYKYREPTPSEDLISEFWRLEKEAESLLNEIRAL